MINYTYKGKEITNGEVFDLEEDDEVTVSSDLHSIQITAGEAWDLVNLPDEIVEMGLEYWIQVYSYMEAFTLAPDLVITQTKEDLVWQFVGSEIPEKYHRYFDWEAYWECDLRHNYTETDNYLFENN